MNNVAAAVSMVIAGATTYSLRLSGAFRWIRKVAEAEWTKYVPPAVLLILAISSVADVSGMLPDPAVLTASLAVLVLAGFRRPLLVSIIGGCFTYVIMHTYLPQHW